MADNADDQMKYPCYFLYGDEGGLITNMVDGRRCLCLFTSSRAVHHFTHAVHEREHGPKRGYLASEVDEVEDRSGLIGRLTAAVDRLEDDGIRFVSIDPIPGQPTKYEPIREFMAAL